MCVICGVNVVKTLQFIFRKTRIKASILTYVGNNLNFNEILSLSGTNIVVVIKS